MLQHAYDGSLWLYDLQSSQGTKLNQRPVETKQFHRLEPGSSIHFGRSSREYIVAQGTAVGRNKRSDDGFNDGIEKMAQTVVATKAKNHGSDLEAALRSAADAVKSPRRN